MTYQEAIDFWCSRINFERRSPKKSDLKLDRMRALLDVLGRPDENLKILHVAGSKGKGSTSALLASILVQAGYRTGLFTSPHLTTVEERIQVDGIPIGRNELAAQMSRIAAAVDRVDGQSPRYPVTFFEIVTALGFLHFETRQVDFAVVEVGLGGRFDSTNVCDPLVSIITNISFDHMRQLGNTLAKIAREKAGIIKPRRPVFSGVRVAEARAVIEQTSREREAVLCQIDSDFTFRHLPGRILPDRDTLPQVQVSAEHKKWSAMPLRLLGEHQAANAALSTMVVDHLNELGYPVADRAIASGLATVVWPARLEVVGRSPFVVLDCAHNVASIEAMLDTLRTCFPFEPTRRVIFASSQDKDLQGMLQRLSEYFDHFYLTRFADNPRCARPEEMAQHLPGRTRYDVSQSSLQAWQRAQADSQPSDLICITGSVFLAGEMRPYLVTKPDRTTP